MTHISSPLGEADASGDGLESRPAGHAGPPARLSVRAVIQRAPELCDLVHLLKVHLSYHESDHVLNLAYNILRGRSTIEDPELLRNDEVHLDALGAQRISDPTTAGDFCRRFETSDVVALMNVVNEAWLKTVWPRQPSEFVERAITDKDGVIASTTGECREGMDISCKGERGFHPPLVPLANTREPLLLVNRSGNRPSHAAGGRLRRLAWRNVDPAPNWGVACSGARFGGPSAAGPRHLTAPRYRPRRPA